MFTDDLFVKALKDKHDKEGKVLGRYFYDAEKGSSLQRFKPQVNHCWQDVNKRL